jgi:hypothetical protein
MRLIVANTLAYYNGLLFAGKTWSLLDSTLRVDS